MSLQTAHANLEAHRRREEDYKSVFTALQNGSDGEATEILARLRMGMDVSAIAELLREPHDETPASCSGGRDMQPSPSDPKNPSWSLRALEKSFLVPLFDRSIWDATEGEGDVEGEGDKDMSHYNKEIWQEPLLQVSHNKSPTYHTRYI